MTVLGIDPGLSQTGWAVLDQLPAGPRLRASGVIETFPDTSLPDRLRKIHTALSDILSEHQPAQAAIEELFFLKAARTIIGTFQARGVILLAVAQGGCSVSDYNPRTVKLTLTGSGDAAKPQMQRVLQKALGLSDILRPDDVADAAAIALCHIRSNRFKKFTVLERIGGRK